MLGSPADAQRRPAAAASDGRGQLREEPTQQSPWSFGSVWKTLVGTPRGHTALTADRGDAVDELQGSAEGD